MQEDTQADADREGRRLRFGWLMYDWANSAYSTAFATAFMPLLWAGFFMPEEGIRLAGRMIEPDAVWSFLVAFAALVVLLIAPTLGAVADMAGAKKRLLMVFCYVGVAAAAPIALCGAGSYAVVAGLSTTPSSRTSSRRRARTACQARASPTGMSAAGCSSRSPPRLS